MDNQRKEFVARAIMGEESLRAPCRKYGVSRPTGYKWLERYKDGENMRDRPNALWQMDYKGLFGMTNGQRPYADLENAAEGHAKKIGVAIFTAL